MDHSPKGAAKLVPSSLGHGLGQTTGGTPEMDKAEAIRILKMIKDTDWADPPPDGVLNSGERALIASMLAGSRDVENFTVTGRQVFYLRDVKEKLLG